MKISNFIILYLLHFANSAPERNLSTLLNAFLPSNTNILDNVAAKFDTPTLEEDDRPSRSNNDLLNICDGAIIKTQKCEQNCRDVPRTDKLISESFRCKPIEKCREIEFEAFSQEKPEDDNKKSKRSVVVRRVKRDLSQFVKSRWKAIEYDLTYCYETRDCERESAKWRR